MPSQGKTKQRGYGYRHKQLRRAWKREVDAGTGTCARCGHPVERGEPWDLDHEDDRSGYLGPSHRACNRATAGQIVRRFSRVW